MAGSFSAYNGKVVDFDPDPVGAYELTTPTSAENMFLLKLRKQSAAALNDAALASLTLADTQRSKPSGKKASVFDSETDWLAVSQVQCWPRSRGVVVVGTAHAADDRCDHVSTLKSRKRRWGKRT